MQRIIPTIFLALTISSAGCYSAKKGREGMAASNTSIGGPMGVAEQGQQGQVRVAALQSPPAEAPAESEKIALDSSAAQASPRVVERKIIRNAELRSETEAPNDGQQKIGSIAEKNGGFVVTSESRLNDGALPATIVNIIVRVPAARFAATLEEILGTGGRVLHKKISGQDVTEEYIDLEARIRTKRALESQFLEIMKQSRKVSEALEVQTQLAEVRTEIVRLEGRRRFLENQSALSTINITLQTPAPAVAATTRGVWHDLKSAFGDGVEIALSIVLDVVRFVIAIIPILVLIVLPGWFLFKLVRRRINWPKRPAMGDGDAGTVPRT